MADKEAGRLVTKRIRKMTPNIFCKIRERVRSLGKISGSKIAETLSPEFPDFKFHTLRDYVCCFTKLSDKTVDFYLNEKISFTVLIELGQSDLDPAEIEFLAEEFVKNELTLSDLVKIKAGLRAGDSYALAIGRVTGDIPESPRDHEIKKIRKEFDGLLDVAMKALRASRFKVSEAIDCVVKRTSSNGTEDERKEDTPAPKKDFDALVGETEAMLEHSRVGISKLIDLLPRSTLEKGQVHSDFFHKAYMLRHILREQYELVESGLKRYSDEQGSPDDKFVENARRLVFAIKEQYEFMNVRTVQYLNQIESFMSTEQRVLEKKKELNHG
jgi:hypothetical protein